MPFSRRGCKVSHTYQTHRNSIESLSPTYRVRNPHRLIRTRNGLAKNIEVHTLTGKTPLLKICWKQLSGRILLKNISEVAFIRCTLSFVVLNTPSSQVDFQQILREVMLLGHFCKFFYSSISNRLSQIGEEDIALRRIVTENIRNKGKIVYFILNLVPLSKSINRIEHSHHEQDMRQHLINTVQMWYITAIMPFTCKAQTIRLKRLPVYLRVFKLLRRQWKADPRLRRGFAAIRGVEPCDTTSSDAER